MAMHSDPPGGAATAPGRRRRPGGGRVWTPKRDETLIALHRTGLSYAAIALHMGISANAAAARIAVLIRRGVLPAKRGKWAAAQRSAAANPAAVSSSAAKP